MSASELLSIRRENAAVGGIRLEQPGLNKPTARRKVRALVAGGSEYNRLVGLCGDD
jgi:hypothetical protein